MVKLDVMDKSENVYFPKIYIVNEWSKDQKTHTTNFVC